MNVVEFIKLAAKKYISDVIDHVEPEDFDAVSVSIESDFTSGAMQMAEYIRTQIALGASLETIREYCESITSISA